MLSRNDTFLKHRSGNCGLVMKSAFENLDDIWINSTQFLSNLNFPKVLRLLETVRVKNCDDSLKILNINLHFEYVVNISKIDYLLRLK